jgi:glycosyltransferase involved in cell wall biosynthesis
MRIAYFITGLGLGGAEVITIDLARRAGESGHDVILVYLSPLDALADTVTPEVGLHALKMRKTPAGLIAALHSARRIVRDFRPDVVHSNMFHSNIFTRLLRLVTPIPALICSEHNQYIGWAGRMWIYALTSPLSDLDTNVSVVAVDEFVRRRAFRPSTATVVYNGVDTRRFAPDRAAGRRIRKQFGIASGEFLWLNVGRLTAAKDQAMLLRAFARMGRGRLMIVGEGDLHGELRRQIIETGLECKAILAGAHSNMADFYNAADCLVISSAWEGFSMAILEAMSCGVPVVSTDVSGAAEALHGREWIVPVRDEVALAQKMLRLMELSRAQRTEIGTTNRTLAARFDLDNIWQQWEQTYRTI